MSKPDERYYDDREEYERDLKKWEENESGNDDKVQEVRVRDHVVTGYGIVRHDKSKSVDRNKTGGMPYRVPRL